MIGLMYFGSIQVYWNTEERPWNEEDIVKLYIVEGVEDNRGYSDER